MKNRQKTSFGRSAFLTILSIAFIFVTILTLVGFNIRRVVNNQDLLTEVLVKELIDSPQFSQFAGEYIGQRAAGATAQGKLGFWSLLAAVPQADLDRIQGMLLPREFLVSMVAITVNEFNLWLEADQTDLQLAWDLSPIKNNLSGEPGWETVNLVFRTLPACTQDQIDLFFYQASTGGNADLICALPAPYDEQQKIIIYNELGAINASIPTSTSVNLMESGSEKLVQTLSATKFIVRAARFIGVWGWVLSAFLLILITAVGVRSLDTAGIWLGLPFMVTGMASLALAVSGRGLLISGISSRLGLDLVPLVVQVIDASFVALSGSILEPLLWEGLAMLAVGGLLFVVMILKRILRK